MEGWYKSLDPSKPNINPYPMQVKSCCTHKGESCFEGHQGCDKNPRDPLQPEIDAKKQWSNFFISLFRSSEILDTSGA